MIHPQSDIAICPKGMTFGRLTRQRQPNFFSKILYSLLKPLHLPIHDSNIRIRHRISGIIFQCFHKVCNRLFKLTHIFIAAASIMKEDGIFGVKLNSKGELLTRVLVVLEFVVDDA